MTTTEAAAALGISPQRVWQLLRAGKLGGRKVGRDWQVDEASVKKRRLLRTTAEVEG
jgi:excisionase family DNA binding protein